MVTSQYSRRSSVYSRWASISLVIGFIGAFLLMLLPTGGNFEQPISYWYGIGALISLAAGLVLFVNFFRLSMREIDRENEQQQQEKHLQELESVEKLVTERQIALEWDGVVIVITEPLEPGPFGGHLHIKLDTDGAEDRIFQFWPDAPTEQFRHIVFGDRFLLKFVKRPARDLLGKIDPLAVGSDLFLYFLDFERV